MDDPSKTRIVGGYMPKSRPWMAMIELKRLGGRPGNYHQCGGSIINKVQIILNKIIIYIRSMSSTNILRRPQMFSKTEDLYYICIMYSSN